jgi:hypothetical protein
MKTYWEVEIHLDAFLTSADSSVGIALGYGMDDRGSRVPFPAGLGIFLFTTASRTALGPTQPPIQWVPGALSLGVKRPGRKADHSPPSSAEVKYAWSLPPLPNTSSWRGAWLGTGTTLALTCSLSGFEPECEIGGLPLF